MAASITKTKGNKVELTTFNNWGKASIIGYKTEEENGKIMVNYIWCKVCARYKNQLLARLKGQVKKNVLAFIDGTNVVTKYQV